MWRKKSKARPWRDDTSSKPPCGTDSQWWMNFVAGCQEFLAVQSCSAPISKNNTK